MVRPHFMKLRICTLLLSLSMLAGLRAGQPTEESVEKMMTVMHAEKTLDQILIQLDQGIQGGLDEGLQGALKGQEPTAAQKDSIAKFKSKLRTTLKEEISFPRMKEYYIQAYQKNLTQDEVNSLIAFYSSPSGRTVVDKIPLAMQDAGILMQNRIAPTLREIQGMVQDFAKELANTK